MRIYGLACHVIGEVVDWYLTKEEAAVALAAALADEPGWVGEVGIVTVEFEVSPN